jgi:asparagine synthase (glutamine-hydrolysing)
MCGICGVIGLDSKLDGETVVRRMLASIVHRGPDEEGMVTIPRVAAGTRRLSIIDLPGGSQPVWNETETIAVVFNGEIYNYRVLRDELEARQHKFRSKSDTEVIVHAYEEWGEDSVSRLRGMFSFAVIELPKGRGGQPARVFMARDRTGIKPLYYAKANGVLLFASEVRALLASGLISQRLSYEGLTSYLLFGSVGEPTTLVEGVFSLQPGHFVTILADDPIQVSEPKSYWNLSGVLETRAETTVPSRDSGSSGILPAQRVRTLLEDAVRSHLIADVPVGVFLSSGIDSTAIAALAAVVQRGIHTFTVSFPDTEFSEAAIAQRTAERLGTQHREMMISGDEMVTRLDEAISALDQPSMDGINTYFVSWAARQAGLKVALSGLGSDELFGGYTSFPATAKIARIAMAAGFVPQPVRRLTALGMKNMNAFQSSPDAFRKASAAWLQPDFFPHSYFFTRALFTPQTFASSLRGDTVAWNSMAWYQWLVAAAQQSRSSDRFAQVSWLELRSYLVNTLLRDTDAMSMRSSLEVRVPFLDTPLMEYVLGLPESVKRRARGPKALLVEALGNLLPEEIINQPKRTFTFPWVRWLRGKLGERVATGLGDWAPALESSLDHRFAQGIWRNFLRGRMTWSRPWSLYVLNEWVKRNLSIPVKDGAERHNSAAVHAGS